MPVSMHDIDEETDEDTDEERDTRGARARVGQGTGQARLSGRENRQLQRDGLGSAGLGSVESKQ